MYFGLSFFFYVTAYSRDLPLSFRRQGKGCIRDRTMLEYGLLVGLVAIAAIIAVTAMGSALSSMFSGAASQL